jgi:hypothetical protein
MTAQRNAKESTAVKWIFTALGVWFVTALVTSAAGVLAQLSPYVVMPLVPTLMLIPAVVFWQVPPVRRVVESFGLRRLTLLHVFRIVAVPLFFWYERHGLLPAVFLERGAWGDLAAGLAALVAVTAWRKPAGYWFAHLVGMADFAMVLLTALALTRANLGSMAGVTALPFSMLPFFFVGLLGSTHLMAYTMLLRSRSDTRTGSPFAHTAEVTR